MLYSSIQVVGPTPTPMATPGPTPVPAVAPKLTATPAPTAESGVKLTEFGYWVTYPQLGEQTWSTPTLAPRRWKIPPMPPMPPEPTRRPSPTPTPDPP